MYGRLVAVGTSQSASLTAPLSGEPYAPQRGVFYEPRVTRGDVISLSLTRRNAASESEAADGRRLPFAGEASGVYASYYGFRRNSSSNSSRSCGAAGLYSG